MKCIFFSNFKYIKSSAKEIMSEKLVLVPVFWLICNIFKHVCRFPTTILFRYLSHFHTFKKIWITYDFLSFFYNYWSTLNKYFRLGNSILIRGVAQLEDQGNYVSSFTIDFLLAITTLGSIHINNCMIALASRRLGRQADKYIYIY